MKHENTYLSCGFNFRNKILSPPQLIWNTRRIKLGMCAARMCLHLPDAKYRQAGLDRSEQVFHMVTALKGMRTATNPPDI